MFKKSTLASAVATAIGVSAVGIGSAQAHSLFFPYVALSDTVTTMISVVNASNENYTPNGSPDGSNLHYRIYYKTAADNSLSCPEFDEFLPTSQYDVQSIDLSGHFATETAGVLFNDPSINNNWEASNKSYALGEGILPLRGYLYIDNNDTTEGVETLTGEAINFDFGSGASWGYQAYSSQGTQFTYANYEWAASRSPSNVTMMPFAEVMTTFLVTPVSYDQAPDVNNNYAARIEFITGLTTRGDVYDRDENLISGTVPQDVVCVGRVDATSLLTAGALNRVADGGWGQLYSYRTLAGAPASFKAETDPTFVPGTAELTSAGVTKLNATDGAVIIKLEYNLGGTINGGAIQGTFNNAITLMPEGPASLAQ